MSTVKKIATVQDTTHNPAPGTRTGRAARTWASGVAFTVVTSLVALFSAPVLLHYLGDERMGAWRAAIEMTAYLIVADLGASLASAILITRRWQERNDQPFGAVIGGIVRLHLKLMFLVVPLYLAAAYVIPHLIDLSDDVRNELTIALLIGVVPVVLYPLGWARAALDAAQLGYLIHGLLILQSLFITVLSVILAMGGYGLIGQGVALSIGGIVCSGAFWAIARRRLNVAATHVETVTFGQLWPMARASVTNSFARRVQTMSDSAIAAVVLGPIAVTNMFLTQRLIVLATGQAGALANATWSALQEVSASGKSELFASRYCDVIRMISSLGLVVGSIALAINAPFVRLWVGSDYYSGTLLGTVTLLNVVMSAVVLVPAWAIDMSGDPGARTTGCLSAASIKLLIAYPLLLLLGTSGVVLAALLTTTFIEFSWNTIKVKQKFGIALRSQWLALGDGLLRSMPALIMGLILALTMPLDTSLATTLGLGLVFGVCCFIYGWFIVLRAAERDQIARKLGAIVPFGHSPTQ